MTARVFRNKAGTFCVSVQVSFTDMKRAAEVARSLDAIKSAAAFRGRTFSDMMHTVLLLASGLSHKEVSK